MRRIVLLVTVALVMAALVLAMAVPAFAAASPQANCVGEAFSNEPPGTKGQQVSAAATTTGGVGEEISSGTQVPREVTCSL